MATTSHSTHCHRRVQHFCHELLYTTIEMTAIKKDVKSHPLYIRYQYISTYERTSTTPGCGEYTAAVFHRFGRKCKERCDIENGDQTVLTFSDRGVSRYDHSVRQRKHRFGFHIYTKRSLHFRTVVCIGTKYVVRYASIGIILVIS